MKNIKYIVFDFDGTLANSQRLAITILNNLADKYKFKKITDDKIEEYRDMSAQQLIKKSGIKYYKIPFVAAQFKIDLKKIIDQIEPFQGIPNMLAQLSKTYKIGILTSNSVENVNIFLKLHNISEYLTFINSQPKIYGKNISLKKIMSKHNLNKQNLIYVGDETRDIEASKKLGIKIISVSWGLNSKRILQKFSPDYLADQPKDILIILLNNKF